MAVLMACLWLLERVYPGYGGVAEFLVVVVAGALFVLIAVNLGHGDLNSLCVPEHITLHWVDSQLSPRAYVTIFVLPSHFRTW